MIHESDEGTVAASGTLTVTGSSFEEVLDVVAEVFARGIDAVCVCVNTRYLPATFCGRRYDADFVAALPPGVDACGENGEFHTFVTDAPRFRRPVTARVAHIDQYVAPAAQGGDAFVFARLVAG
jgi:diphthamide synthase (EF-2-diphthine--ammonia ligase)